MKHKAMKTLIKLVLTPLLFYLFYTGAIAQKQAKFSPANEHGIITGTITDSATSEPILGVIVSVEGTALSDMSGSDGIYAIGQVKPGTHTVTATADDYYTRTKTGVVVEEGLNTSVNFIMTPEVLAPELLSAEPIFGQVTLTWEPIGGSNRTGYWIVYGDCSDPCWTIFISQAAINGQDMIAGDEVGVFDGEVLVGAFTLDQICTAENQFENDLIAWSTLQNGDGYTPEHPVTFKAYDEQTNTIYEYAQATYYDPYGDAWAEPVFPEGEAQYSIVGLQFSDPYTPTFNVYSIDEGLIAGGLTGISYTDTLENPQGQYCYYVTQMLPNCEESYRSNIECAWFYPPTGSIQGTVSIAENYNPVPDAVVTIEGTGISAITGEDGTYAFEDVEAGTYDISVEIFGYENQIQSGVEVLENETTTADFTLLPMGPTMLNLEPGPDYVTLTWEPITGSDRIYHFQFEGGYGGDPVWTVFLSGITHNGQNMGIGDEVAVFDGGIMVGATTLIRAPDSLNTFENDMLVYSTLMSGDGFTPGNPVSFKGWLEAEQMEVEDFEANYLNWYGDAWDEPVFPQFDGEYSIIDLAFNSQPYEPGFNVYKLDEGLIAEQVMGNTYVDSINYNPGEEYCCYVTQLLPNGQESDSSNILCVTTRADFQLVEISGDELTMIPDELKKMTINIYPNPAGNEVHIETGRRMEYFSIYTTAGHKINEVAMNGKSHKTLNVSDLKPGIYLLKFYSREGLVLNRKLLIM